MIREGRVFAYGNRRGDPHNPDVRRYYIGERFDVGHLLEQIQRRRLGHDGHDGDDQHPPRVTEVLLDHIDLDHMRSSLPSEGSGESPTVTL